MLLVCLPTVGCKAGEDPLFKAIRAKDTKEVEKLLSQGKVQLDPPQLSNQVNKPLAFAAAYGNLDIVKLILAKGADINGQVAYGNVPLIKAAEHENKDILKFLIEKGADVNIPNAFGVTPFIGICGTEDVELAQLALKYGGKVNEAYVSQTSQRKGEKNLNALQSAVMYGKTDTVKLLLKNGGDPNLKDPGGKTCLELAREKKHDKIVDLLK